LCWLSSTNSLVRRVKLKRSCSFMFLYSLNLVLGTVGIEFNEFELGSWTTCTYLFTILNYVDHGQILNHRFKISGWTVTRPSSNLKMYTLLSYLKDRVCEIFNRCHVQSPLYNMARCEGHKKPWIYQWI